VPQRKKNHSKT